MKLLTLSDEMIETILDRLKHRWSWNNGLVGHETFYCDGKLFVSKFKDLREPDSNAHKGLGYGVFG